jgi:hypothetical protein
MAAAVAARGELRAQHRLVDDARGSRVRVQRRRPRAPITPIRTSTKAGNEDVRVKLRIAGARRPVRERASDKPRRPLDDCAATPSPHRRGGLLEVPERSRTLMLFGAGQDPPQFGRLDSLARPKLARSRAEPLAARLRRAEVVVLDPAGNAVDNVGASVDLIVCVIGFRASSASRPPVAWTVSHRSERSIRMPSGSVLGRPSIRSPDGRHDDARVHRRAR